MFSGFAEGDMKISGLLSVRFLKIMVKNRILFRPVPVINNACSLRCIWFMSKHQSYESFL